MSDKTLEKTNSKKSTEKHSKVLDRAGSVRTGEELDTASFRQWLREHYSDMQQHSWVSPDMLQDEPVVTQYSGGASNWTYCLSYPGKELILRRAPAGTKAKGAHDMGREFKLQQALKPVYSYVPQMLAFCEDETVIGAEFYLMEKLTGVIPRKNLPKDIEADPISINQMCKSVLDCLIELHSVDYQSAGLGHIGKGAGYVERQIEGWIGRYEKAKTWNVTSGKSVIQWLRQNMPTKERICIIHNDFRFDNVVLDPEDITHVLGILDWEMATLGDPMMDLGNTLAYWVEPKDDFLAQMMRRQPTHLSGMLTREEVIDYYCQKMGFEKSDFTFYEAYGLFRLAVIVQQIYYRYHHKQTRNPAYKRFWIFVNYLIWRAWKVTRQQG